MIMRSALLEKTLVLLRVARPPLQSLRSLFFVGIVVLGRAVPTQAQALPPHLREFYQAAELDPDNNPCLTANIPTTPEEHAVRQKCMLEEYIRHGEPSGLSDVPYNHLRAYNGQADMMESAASLAELQYLQSRGPH